MHRVWRRRADHAPFLHDNVLQRAIHVAAGVGHHRQDCALLADDNHGDKVASSCDVANGGAFSGDPQVLMGLFLANPTEVGTIPVVPEPQTWALMAIGLAGIVLVRRRRCVTRA